MDHTVKLSELTLGYAAVILKMPVSGAGTARMKSLGITEGAEITPMYKSMFGDPTAYRIKGCVVALRRSESSKIMVAPLGDGGVYE